MCLNLNNKNVINSVNIFVDDVGYSHDESYEVDGIIARPVTDNGEEGWNKEDEG